MTTGSGVIARLTARGRYALAAMVALARDPNVRTSTQAISESHGIPLRFLEGILADLRRAGLVESKRGPSGGFALAVNPEACTVATVLQALSRPEPDAADAPPVDAIQVRIEAAVGQCLHSVTLSELLEAGVSPGMGDSTMSLRPHHA